MVSDYRYRGVTLSHGGPALQASVDVSSQSEWIAGAWTSLALNKARGADEVDLYVGRSGFVGTVEYQLMAYAYLTPRAADTTYAEAQLYLRHHTDVLAIEGQVTLAPRQGSAHQANLYTSLSTSVPVLHDRLAFRVSGGFEHGLVDRKLDATIGLEGAHGTYRFALSAVFSNASYDSRRNTAAMVLALSHHL